MLKSIIKHNFFNNYNNISCYWAGFIAADGYLLKDYDVLGIKLSVKDIEHLNKFKNSIQPEKQIKIYKSSGFGEGFEYCRLIINSKQVKNNLIKKFNIKPNKTLNLKPPRLKNINHILAFITGYIDGDGSIFLSKSHKIPTIEILGTKSFLKWILKSLKSYNFNTKVTLAKKDSKVYRIKLHGTGKVIKLTKDINSLNLPKLNRKWNKIDINRKSLRNRW